MSKPFSACNVHSNVNYYWKIQAPPTWQFVNFEQEYEAKFTRPIIASMYNDDLRDIQKDCRIGCFDIEARKPVAELQKRYSCVSLKC